MNQDCNVGRNGSTAVAGDALCCAPFLQEEARGLTVTSSSASLLVASTAAPPLTTNGSGTTMHTTSINATLPGRHDTVEPKIEVTPFRSSSTPKKPDAEETTTMANSTAGYQESVTLNTLENTYIEEVEATPEEILKRKYSVSELVACLGSGEDISRLPPELERRVLDFRLAQQKRIEKYGESQRWGIFGMYAHLANIRTDLEWAEDAAWRRHNDEPYLTWGDFDEVRKTGFNRPWFTYALITSCTIMLIIEFSINDWKIEDLEANPLIGPSAETLVLAGARDTAKIVQEGQWYRLVTPLVLHAGIIHYVVNMGALWFIGGAVEQSHGAISAILLFLIPGVGGNILSAIFLPQFVSVGASGGIFGLIGGCLADITVNWNLLFIKDCESDKVTWKRNFMAMFWIFLEIFANVLLGLTPYVDNFTHLGGLIYGVCCGWSTIEYAALYFFGFRADICAKTRLVVVRFFGLIASVVFIMITTAWLATSEIGDNPCPSCRYVSCVPFPWGAETKWWYCDDCDFVSADLYRTNDGDVPYYERVDLTCPNDEIEILDVSAEQITDRDVMRRKLPDYCREFCSEVFSS